nr:type II secretion system protein N [Methylonatrum kenyense]
MPVRLEGPSGSAWNGRAARLHYQDEVFHDLRWRFLPARLLSARATVDFSLRAEQGRIQGRASSGPRRDLQLQDLRADLPVAQVLRLADQGRLPVDVDGRFDAFLEHVRIDADGSLREIRGLLNWIEGGFTLADPVELGSYALRIEGDQDRLQGQLQDIEAVLRLEGEITLLPGSGDIRGEIIMQALDGADPALIENMRFAGLPEPTAENQVRFQGNLADPFGFRGDIQ